MTPDNKLGISLNSDHDIFKQLNFPHLKKRASSISTIQPIKKEKNKLVESCSPAASFLAGFMNEYIKETIIGMEDYKILDIIGFGGFSIVHKVLNLKTNELQAVKIINHQLMNRIDKIRLQRELTIWKSLNHPRIIQLSKIIQTDQQSYLLCDYCSNGNLLKLLNFNVKLNEEQAKRIFKEICQGVYYLHVDCKVAHKDLKLENILISDQGHIKICDFGLAVYQSTQEFVLGGSLAYISPEQINQSSPLTCPKSDIWSLGVILYALVVGHLPFTDAYEPRLQQKILQAKYDVPHHLSLPLNQLICHCLDYNVKERFTIDQVLNSEWLNK